MNTPAEPTSRQSASAELWAGLTTFATVSYIVVLTPALLAAGAGMPFGAALTATVLTGFLLTFLMGTYAKLPVCIIPGAGLNTLFALSMVQSGGMPWQTALGACVWGGLILVVVILSGQATRVRDGVPEPMRRAAVAGIGLFVTLIGLRNTGIIAPDKVQLLRLDLSSWSALLGTAGFVLMVWGHARRKALAIILGIATVTLVAGVTGVLSPPEESVTMPSFATSFSVDLLGALQSRHWPALFTVAIVILFDSIPVLDTLLTAAEVPPDERPTALRKALELIAGGTVVAACLGTSPVIPAVESLVGIEARGRSGRTAIVTAICFLPFLFLGPLAEAIPAYATGPALILVGSIMFLHAGEIRSDRGAAETIPAFITVVAMPFTASIAYGLMLGFSSFLLLNPIVGGFRRQDAIAYLLGLCSIVLLALERCRVP